MKTFQRLFTAFLCIALILQSCALRSAMVISKAEAQENAPETMSISYTDSYGLVVVPVVIEGKTYRFIFDTGAGTTVVSTEIAALSSFKKKGGVKVRDAYQSTSKLEVGAISELSLGKLKFSKVGAVVNDFSSNPQFRCIGIDGILGMNVLRNNNWRIDYDEKKLSAYDAEMVFKLGGEINSFDFVSKSGIPYINLRVNGKEERFMVDTGKNGEIISVDEDMKIEGTSNATVGQNAFGMFGKTEVDTTLYFHVNLSDSLGFALENVCLSQTKNAQSNMGNGFLKKNYASVFFDFKNRRMHCINPKNAHNGYKSYGVSAMVSGDHYVIGVKDLGLSIDVEELSLQDTILAINGEVITSENFCAVGESVATYRREGKTIALRILHNGEEVDVKLPLKGTSPF